jgi:hypothetical protein
VQALYARSTCRGAVVPVNDGVGIEANSANPDSQGSRYPLKHQKSRFS